MFNSGYKKEALQALEAANSRYQKAYEDAVSSITSLHENRLKAVEVIKRAERLSEKIAGKPKDLGHAMEEVHINRQRFEDRLNKLELENKKAGRVSGSLAGAGVAAGAGIAAFGPSAAMAVAMTFGTASTGTAIAALSGAAATNAALAWLGGGALAAGGAGMAGGSAFLAMTGPVGWAIGGAALLGGGLLANGKNKKIAEKAEASTRVVKKETERIKETKTKVQYLEKETIELNRNISYLLSDLEETVRKLVERNVRRNSSQNNALINYELFCNGKDETENRHKLYLLINTTRSLSEKIGVAVS